MQDSNNNHDYNIDYRNRITIYAFFCHRDVRHKYTPLFKRTFQNIVSLFWYRL